MIKGARFRDFRSGSLFLIVVFSIILSFNISPIAKLTVTPLSLRIEVTPGESSISSINLKNTDSESTRLGIRLVDWWRSPGGQLQLLKPGTRERSCSGWISYETSSLTLGPGSKEDLTLKMKVPEGVSGDHWSMLLVTERPRQGENEQKKTDGETRNYAIKILHKDPRNIEKRAAITKIELVQSNPTALSVTYRNKGTTHLYTSGRVEIKNVRGNTVEKFEIKEFPTLPGEKHNIVVKSSEKEGGLSPGQYFAVVVMDFGGDHLIQGGLPFEISSGG